MLKLGDKKQNGFALVEMLIYIIIFVLIALSIVSSLTYITKSYRQLKNERDILISAQTVLNEITLDVRQAKNIDSTNSLFNSATGRLTLLGKRTDNTDLKYEFYLTNGQIHLKENDVERGALTSDQVTVSEFYVYRLVNSITEGITVRLKLEAENEVSRVKTFSATSILRNVF